MAKLKIEGSGTQDGTVKTLKLSPDGVLLFNDTPLFEHVTVTSSGSYPKKGGDRRLIVTGDSESPNPTISFTIDNGVQEALAEIYAIVDCTIQYEEKINGATTSVTKNLKAGNMVSLYFSDQFGWKVFGIYGAVWN